MVILKNTSIREELCSDSIKYVNKSVERPWVNAEVCIATTVHGIYASKGWYEETVSV
jgi:hypothetical protein